ncbi:MAG: hypothetical protein R3F54_05335 [Alphaproteobacteria bacterium]
MDVDRLGRRVLGKGLVDILNRWRRCETYRWFVPIYQCSRKFGRSFAFPIGLKGNPSLNRQPARSISGKIAPMDEVRSKITKEDKAIQEYYFLQELIEKYDSKALIVKSWSVTLSAASIGFAFAERLGVIFLLGSLSTLIFWYLESRWKYYQRIMIERASEIEKYVNGDSSAYSGPKICTTFASEFGSSERLGKAFRVFFYRNVYIPHIIIFSFGLLLFVLQTGIFFQYRLF